MKKDATHLIPVVILLKLVSECPPFCLTHHHDDKGKSHQQVGHGQGRDSGRYHEGYTHCPEACQSHGKREAQEIQKGGLQT